MNRRPASKALEIINLMDGFYDWLETDEADHYLKIKSVLEVSMRGVELDVRERLFIFKRKRRTFSEVVEWIGKKMKLKDVTDIQTCLMNWMEMSYLPSHIDKDDIDAMDAFGREIEKWLEFDKKS